jgi:lipoprotein NlpD
MDTLKWRWPTGARRITNTFLSKDPARQGIDISGELGSPVFVAAPGRVVYAGSGLAGYGRLIIVKHNEKYLSAYAHSNKIHVKEGDDVKAGQKIADMGSPSMNGADGRAMLHFEIRRNGKPVDPLRYLPR